MTGAEIAIRSLQIWKFSWGRPRPPYKARAFGIRDNAPPPPLKNLARALILSKINKVLPPCATTSNMRPKFHPVKSTTVETYCKRPLLVSDRDHLFGWRFLSFCVLAVLTILVCLDTSFFRNCMQWILFHCRFFRTSSEIDSCGSRKRPLNPPILGGRLRKFRLQYRYIWQVSRSTHRPFSEFSWSPQRGPGNLF